MRRRRRGIQPVVSSMKNVFQASFGVTGTATVTNVAKAVDSPPSASAPDQCRQGSIIKAIWLTFDVCGLAGTGVLNNFSAYLMKNPGASLTPPAPVSIGTSNEKKFIIKFWRAMIMRNQDGNVPYHWEGWIKIPKLYHRMGTDDTWVFVIDVTASLTGHAQVGAIYKWYY